MDNVKELELCPFCGCQMENSMKGFASHPNNLCIIQGNSFPIEAWNTRNDNWISVDDRLPEVDDGINPRVRITDGYTECYAKNYGGKWTVEGFPFLIDIRNITHWKALSHPSKENKWKNLTLTSL